MPERARLQPGPAAWREIAARRRDLETAMIGVEVATDRRCSRDKVLMFNAGLRSALPCCAVQHAAHLVGNNRRVRDRSPRHPRLFVPHVDPSKARRGGRLPVQLPRQLVAPGIQLPRRNTVPADDLCRPGPRLKALRHDRLLLLDRPAPASLAPRDQFRCVGAVI